MTDPSTAFFAAALAAGIVEGSSVLRHYAGLHCVDSETNEINGNQPPRPHQDGASSSNIIQPSVSLPSFAAYSILYGMASVPLGVIGASPGVGFLPKRLRGATLHAALDATQNVAKRYEAETTKLSNDKNHANLDSEESNKISEKSSIQNANKTVNDLVATLARPSSSEMQSASPSSTESSAPVIAGTGRGMGRLLRQENMKKITAMHHQSNYNEPGSRLRNGPKSADAAESTNGSSSENNPHPELGGAINYASNHQKIRLSDTEQIQRTQSIPRTPRFTAKFSTLLSTLDGSPLPTSMAEAMRRSRILFIGAGLVSLALSRNHYTHNQMNDYGESNDGGNKVGFHQVKHHETNNDMALRMRLRKGMSSSGTSFMTGIFSPEDSLSQIISRDHVDSLRNFTWQILCDAISTSLEWMKSYVGVDLNKSPFRWIAEWKSKQVRGSGGVVDTRPIALRLVMDERQLPMLTLSNNNDVQSEQKSDSSFLLLPILCPGCCIRDYRNCPSGFWALGSSPKDWTLLPLEQSWLHRSQQQENNDGDKESSMPPSLIIEANTAGPLRDMLRRRYGDGLGNESKQSSELENDSSSFDRIRFCTRILQNLLFERFGPFTTTSDDKTAGNDHVMTTSIIIRSHEIGPNCDEIESIATTAINVYALDVLRSAIFSEVTRISKNPFATYCHEPHNKSASHVHTGLDNNQQYFFATENELTSEDSKTASNSKRNKIWDIALTTVDVLGTSIRHLTISTYRFATAITDVFVTQKSKPKKSHMYVEKNTFSNMIHVVSRHNSLSKWISENFLPRGWKVNDCVTYGGSTDIKNVGGVVLVYGSNDMDTCEIACSILERNHRLVLNDDTKLILLLDEMSNHCFVEGVVKSVCDRVFGSTNFRDKLTILCTSSIYEETFAVVKECLASGMTPHEANLQLIKSLSAGELVTYSNTQ
ncbi:hypothetical protein ACHAXS_009968 [Conticribra weissflogii]